MNLWIDDVRDPPDDTWAVARTYADAYRLLRRYKYDVASFDHDLGDHEIGHMPALTGYDLLCMIERGYLNCPGEIRIHSMNPVGRQRMHAVLNSLLRSGRLNQRYDGPDIR